MATETAKELHEFHRYLTAKLATQEIDLSPEEALDEWRQLHPEIEACAEDVAAIQEALDDRAKGDRGILFEEFDLDFRKRHHLSA